MPILPYSTKSASSGGGGGWSLVSKGTLNMDSGGAGATISGLNGDTDLLYKLVFLQDNLSFNLQYGISFNAFSGGATNYDNVGSKTNGTGTSGVSLTSTNCLKPSLSTNCHNSRVELIIYAASGVTRIVQVSGSFVDTTSLVDCTHVNATMFWTDTATNVTSLSFVDFVGHGGTGSYWLYKIT